ncbi:hypothetical protein KDX16_30780 [Burkholderia vietnamiensis]|uniref:hypothetical protein n=1 Tax=Burkholderia vietnamiensis TaxID=60552 RepID=UPI001B992300|nr:hypothetical protein [Burkholderia vietnamiensis]MBR7920185.1 hypothetical protein [Burkholderia vietnamiensis]MBR8205276.1 hypothetical protein [Burkholderia vietnamiensis]
MTFDELCAAHPNARRVAHIDANNGITLTFGTSVVEWPSDWPEEGIAKGFFEDRGIELLREVAA